MKKNKGSRRKKKKNKSNKSSDSPTSVETTSDDSQENNTASLPINNEPQAANRRQVNDNTSAQSGFLPGWSIESLQQSFEPEDSKVISEESITPRKPAPTEAKPSPRNIGKLPPSTPKF